MVKQFIFIFGRPIEIRKYLLILVNIVKKDKINNSENKNKIVKILFKSN